MAILKNIQSTAKDYDLLTNFFAEHKDEWFSTIHLSLKNWFNANMAAPLGALLDLLQENINTIQFDHIDPKIETILRKNDFLSHFSFPSQHDIHNTTISYQKLKPDDSRYFQQYVNSQLFGRPELPTMSNGLRKKMAEAIFELFVNAQIHSETKNIYTCGQFFPMKNTIQFCIVDTGIGFQERIRRRFNQEFSPVESILWAVQDRHTTKTNVSGGIGLALLHEFAKQNRGCIQIISGKGFYQYDSKGTHTELLSAPFIGTIVNVSFKTDDVNNYALVDDQLDNDLF